MKILSLILASVFHAAAYMALCGFILKRKP